MKRVQLQPAYVLHRRSYRETSFLIEVFTEEYGRLSLIAKGVRKAKSSNASLLQPFVPLIISWSGKSELMTLTQVEPAGLAKTLHGDCLFAGLYLNELLIYLLQKWDAHPRLFHFYTETLMHLQNQQRLEEKILRVFEKFLLEELGYGLFPSAQTVVKSFVASEYYRFVPEQGFVLIEQITENANNVQHIFSGKTLLAISQDVWHDAQTLQDAKRLMRLVLSFLLGERTIYSRRLFIQPEEGAYAK